MGKRTENGGADANEADAQTAKDRLEELRSRIVQVDDTLIRLVGDRRDLALEVGRVKRTLGLPVLDPAQEARVVRRAAERARAMDVDEELARDVIWRIIAAARQVQENRSTWGPGDMPAPPSGEP